MRYLDNHSRVGFTFLFAGFPIRDVWKFIFLIFFIFFVQPLIVDGGGEEMKMIVVYFSVALYAPDETGSSIWDDVLKPVWSLQIWREEKDEAVQK